MFNVSTYQRLQESSSILHYDYFFNLLFNSLKVSPSIGIKDILSNENINYFLSQTHKPLNQQQKQESNFLTKQEKHLTSLVTDNCQEIHQLYLQAQQFDLMLKSIHIPFSLTNYYDKYLLSLRLHQPLLTSPFTSAFHGNMKNQEYSALTSKGYFYKDINEDSISFTTNYYAVIDGVGGAKMSSIASHLTDNYLKAHFNKTKNPIKLFETLHHFIQACNEYYTSSSPLNPTTHFEPYNIPKEMLSYIESLPKFNTPSKKDQIGCTLGIYDKNIMNPTIYTIGDSSAYVIGDTILLDSTAKGFYNIFIASHQDQPEYKKMYNQLCSTAENERRLKYYSCNYTRYLGDILSVPPIKSYPLSHIKGSPNTYVVLFTDGIGDSITSQDLLQLKKFSYSATEFANNIEHFLLLHYTLSIFENISVHPLVPEWVNINKYINTTPLLKDFQNIYYTNKQQKHYSATYEYMFNLVKNTTTISLIPLLQQVINTPSTYSRGKVNLKALNTKQNVNILAKNRSLNSEHYHVFFEQLQANINTLHIVNPSIKPDNYSIIVTEL